MILRSLKAEGFMRWESLELTDLPRGVVAITGENEAGKTTIGEAVAFALFGRTVRTEATDPSQAIHWDRDACRTSLELELTGKGVYRVERLVDRVGTFEARLFGPPGPNGGELLAEGPRPVAQALQELLGFDFSIFRYSFYVAQHELDLIQRDQRDNARRIVHDMLGITTLERGREHLEEQLAELRERAETLDRDLVVARALHTESLPLRQELETHAARAQRAEAGFARAEAEEAEARAGRERAEAALTACGEREQALLELEVSTVSHALLRGLSGARARLLALAGAADERSRTARSTVEDERGREDARKALQVAGDVERQGAALVARVAARRDQLRRELSEATGPDGLPARLQGVCELEAREQRLVRRRTWGGVALLVLALAAGGCAAALRLPEGQPALTFPARELVSPRLGLTWRLSPEGVFWPLVAVGGAALTGFVVAMLARGKALARLEADAAEHARLAGMQGEEQSELAALEKFKLGPLRELEEALRPSQDPGVRAALKAVQEAAGQLASSAQDPSTLMAQARGRVNELEEARRAAERQLAEGARVAAAARAIAAELEPLQGLSGGEAGPLPVELAELAADVDKTAAAAVRMKVELEALRAGRTPPPIEAALAGLAGAVRRACEQAGEDAQRLLQRYEDQSGLSELTRAREIEPSAEDLRAVVRREREVTHEVLGDAEALRGRLAQAEGRLRAALGELFRARAELDEVQARTQRLEEGRRRLDELEQKIHELQHVLGPTHRELRVHGEAIALLEDLVESLKARFGPAITRYMEVVLPRLTGGRYRRARVDAELDIRVYSSERGDFVRLIDLSLGTADQVLLALRLGLARALIGARGIEGGHFLFLDEPLVSADEQREQAFLELLRTFDREFAQIFVTSPRSLDGGPLACRLQLTREARALRLETSTA